MSQEPLQYESDLVELADVPIEEVMSADRSVLADALRRLHAEADHPEEILAGFNSSI